MHVNSLTLALTHALILTSHPHPHLSPLTSHLSPLTHHRHPHPYPPHHPSPPPLTPTPHPHPDSTLTHIHTHTLSPHPSPAPPGCPEGGAGQARTRRRRACCSRRSPSCEGCIRSLAGWSCRQARLRPPPGRLRARKRRRRCLLEQDRPLSGRCGRLGVVPPDVPVGEARQRAGAGLSRGPRSHAGGGRGGGPARDGRRGRAYVRWCMLWSSASGPGAILLRKGPVRFRHLHRLR